VLQVAVKVEVGRTGDDLFHAERAAAGENVDEVEAV
jgi:hypothetical protein